MRLPDPGGVFIPEYQQTLLDSVKKLILHLYRINPDPPPMPAFPFISGFLFKISGIGEAPSVSSGVFRHPFTRPGFGK